jgi:serine phosphatase RsbU (regulator of sigma subunit)
MVKKITLIIFAQLLLSFSLIAGEVFYVVDEENIHQSFADFLKVDYEKLPNNSLNLGFFDGTVLLKVVPDSSTTIIELQNPNLDEIYVYQNGEMLYATGDYYPFKQKPIVSKYFRFPVSDKTHPLYFKIVHHGDQFFLPVNFLNDEKANTFDFIDNFINGFYYGITIIILLLNLFMFLGANEKPNFFYVFYLLGLALLQFSLAGYAYQFLWPNSPYWSNHSLPFLASFSVYFLVLFVLNFLNVKKYLPKWYSFLIAVSYLLLLNMLLSLIPSNITYKFSILFINGLTLLLNTLIIPLSVIMYKKYKVKSAKFFILAFSFLIVAVFIFVMRNLGIMQSNFVTNNILLVGSALEVTLLTFAIVEKFRKFKADALRRLEKINKLQSQQNIMLEKQVAERTRALSEKNKEITDSLLYAKRIQDALIPSEKYVQQFFNESFVLFMPKDIVSGDFYWVSPVTTSYEDKENKPMIVFSVGDCTGHGVPGAIISVIGLKILNQSLKQPQINSPAEALDYLNIEISNTLNTHVANKTIKDGMDIALCALDQNSNTLYYAGAKNPIYIIRNDELIELKADRNAIGCNDQNEHYTNQSIQLQKGDTIYLFTDGYADQFGGEKGKKLKYKRFKEILLEIQNLSMKEQKEYLAVFFNQWKGTLEQIDDVCVLGVKI